MVGACQQNSGIFIVRGGGAGLGPDEMPVGAEAGLAAGSERDADDQITEAGSGLRARCRWCRGWARSGQGPDEMPAEAEAGLAAEPPGTEVGSGTSRDRGRRRANHRGRRRNLQGPDEMPAGAEAGQAAEPPGTG